MSAPMFQDTDEHSHDSGRAEKNLLCLPA